MEFFSIAQITGYVAFLLLVAAFLQTSDLRTKLILTIGQAVLVLHFFLLSEPL